MNRNDFKEDSVQQAIFDYWNRELNKSEFEEVLDNIDRRELVDFIIEAQADKRFADGYCHP